MSTGSQQTVLPHLPAHSRSKTTYKPTDFTLCLKGHANTDVSSGDLSKLESLVFNGRNDVMYGDSFPLKAKSSSNHGRTVLCELEIRSAACPHPHDGANRKWKLWLSVTSTGGRYSESSFLLLSPLSSNCRDKHYVFTLFTIDTTGSSSMSDLMGLVDKPILLALSTLLLSFLEINQIKFSRHMPSIPPQPPFSIRIWFCNKNCILLGLFTFNRTF